MYDIKQELNDLRKHINKMRSIDFEKDNFKIFKMHREAFAWAIERAGYNEKCELYMYVSKSFKYQNIEIID
jgi:hypothetical protein